MPSPTIKASFLSLFHSLKINDVGGDEEESMRVLDSLSIYLNNVEVHAPKCICFISQYRFNLSLCRDYLCYLYRYTFLPTIMNINVYLFITPTTYKLQNQHQPNEMPYREIVVCAAV